MDGSSRRTVAHFTCVAVRMCVAQLFDSARSARVSASEARKILNVSDKPTVEEVEKAFEHIFEANSPERGSSFYLQSKGKSLVRHVLCVS